MTPSNASYSRTYIDPKLFLQPFWESFRLQNGQKLAKCGNLTLKYALFDLEDDLKAQM